MDDPGSLVARGRVKQLISLFGGLASGNEWISQGQAQTPRPSPRPSIGTQTIEVEQLDLPPPAVSENMNDDGHDCGEEEVESHEQEPEEDEVDQYDGDAENSEEEDSESKDDTARRRYIRGRSIIENRDAKEISESLGQVELVDSLEQENKETQGEKEQYPEPIAIDDVEEDLEVVSKEEGSLRARRVSTGEAVSVSPEVSDGPKSIVCKQNFVHPNVVELKFAVVDQSNHARFKVVESPGGGKLFDVIRTKTHSGRLSSQHVQFYAAELWSVLNHLHERGFVHGNLKPSSFLLTADGHLKLATFSPLKNGAKLTEAWVAENKPFQGYASPEVVEGSDVSSSSDVWSFGCALFHMMAGFYPFTTSEGTAHSVGDIVTGRYQCPDFFDSTFKDLISKLIIPGIGSRMKTSDIKNHPFFQGLEMSTLSKQTPPPLLLVSYSIVNTVEEPVEQQPNEGGEDEDENVGREKTTSVALFTLGRRLTKTGDWSVLMEEIRRSMLVPGECILHARYVHKRVGISVKKRCFVLTDLPRIFFVDPDMYVKKAQIEFCDIDAIELTGGPHFNIHCTSRTFYLKDLEGSGKFDWLESLSKLKIQLRSLQEDFVKQNVYQSENAILSSIVIRKETYKDFVIDKATKREKEVEKEKFTKYHMFLTTHPRILLTKLGEKDSSETIYVRSILKVKPTDLQAFRIVLKGKPGELFDFTFCSQDASKWVEALVGVSKVDPLIYRVKEKNILNLDPKEKVMFSGLVQKKKARKTCVPRLLVLTNGPRLVFVNAQELTVIKEIPWIPEMRVQPITPNFFRVSHKGRKVYKLWDPIPDASYAWQRLIHYLQGDNMEPRVPSVLYSSAPERRNEHSDLLRQ